MDRENLYSPVVPFVFPQVQNSISSTLPKRIYPVSLRMERKISANPEETSSDKFSKRGLTNVSEKKNLRAFNRRPGVREGVTAHKRCYSSHL